MVKIRSLFLFLLIACCIHARAQEKFEREYRLKKENIPSKAVEFVKKFNFDRAVKWFGEESLQGKSIEAKVKFNKTKYSIEFDTLGNLQDVEIEIPFQKIQKNSAQKIQEFFAKDFQKFKIIKIQKQFSGTPAEVLNDLKNNGNSSSIKYEIVVKGKDQSGRNLYEYTFSSAGDFEKKEKIIFRNSDHLEY